MHRSAGYGITRLRPECAPRWLGLTLVGLDEREDDEGGSHIQLGGLVGVAFTHPLRRSGLVHAFDQETTCDEFIAGRIEWLPPVRDLPTYPPALAKLLHGEVAATQSQPVAGG